MVGDQTDRDVFYIILMIFTVCKLTYFISQCTNRIYIENGIYVLNNACQTLQTHTGIDILLYQLRVVVVSVIIELGKYVVPDLHITVTVTSYGTARFAAAVFFTTVIVNLRTRTAGACAMLPEVIFLFCCFCVVVLL